MKTMTISFFLSKKTKFEKRALMNDRVKGANDFECRWKGITHEVD